MNNDEAAAAPPPSSPHRGHVATAVGVLLGAHLGIVAGAILGTFAYLPFKQEAGGGWDVLIGSFFGGIVGVPIGGALGCLIALRVRRHGGAGRTSLLAAGLLLLGVLVLGGVFRLAQTADISGWWLLLALEGPILATALLARRLGGKPD